MLPRWIRKPCLPCITKTTAPLAHFLTKGGYASSLLQFFPAVPPPLVLLSPCSAERAAGASYAGSTLLEGNESFTSAKRWPDEEMGNRGVILQIGSYHQILSLGAPLEPCTETMPFLVSPIFNCRFQTCQLSSLENNPWRHPVLYGDRLRKDGIYRYLDCRICSVLYLHSSTQALWDIVT